MYVCVLRLDLARGLFVVLFRLLYILRARSLLQSHSLSLPTSLLFLIRLTPYHHKPRPTSTFIQTPTRQAAQSSRRVNHPTRQSILAFQFFLGFLPIGGRREVHVPEDGDDVGEEHAELQGDEREVDGVGQRPELVVGLCWFGAKVGEIGMIGSDGRMARYTHACGDGTGRDGTGRETYHEHGPELPDELGGDARHGAGLAAVVVEL